MKPTRYLKSSRGVYHVSGHALQAVEDALAGQGFKGVEPFAHARTAARSVRFLFKAGGLRRLCNKAPTSAMIVPMMGFQEALFFPWAYRRELIPVVFDCVPSQYAWWERLFRLCHVQRAFFTSSMVVEHFREVFPHGEWHWMPEAIELEKYRTARHWEARDIDVLEFGRKYLRYHSEVRDVLSRHGLRHVFERTPGQLVFPDRQAFIEGLGRSKISICFPQSQTHPERFGSIETLTQRYLESMACGALIVGHAPAELVQLFGYDPVIGVDWKNPVGQLRELLARPQDHDALRARNQQSVERCGHIRNRAAELAAQLERLGYTAAESAPVSMFPTPL